MIQAMVCSLVFMSGAGNVFFGPDEVDDLRCVAAGHALEFTLAEQLWIANHAALGAAEGYVDYCALPGHPAGQCAYFVQSDFGRVTDSAFSRAARDVVLNAKAGEHLNTTIVHGHGKMHYDFAGRSPEQLPQAFIEIQLACREIEPRALSFPGIDLLVQSHGLCCDCHIFLQFIPNIQVLLRLTFAHIRRELNRMDGSDTSIQ
jgi:hypothetical protein